VILSTDYPLAGSGTAMVSNVGEFFLSSLLFSVFSLL